MINIDLQAKYVRTALILLLFGVFLTAIGLSVFHFMQDEPFLLDLVMPPIISILTFSCLVFLYKDPENIGRIIKIVIVSGAVIICMPPWYFSILASQSTEVVLLEAMPPVTSFLLPITMAMVILLKPRIATILVLVTWTTFVTPIFGFLMLHPEQLTPRAIDILIMLGPTMFIIMTLLLIGQGLKRDVSKLSIEKSDLKSLAERDALTGLYNRRAGDAFISENIEQCDSEFGVIMCDIDHFKRINDEHGHDVGDATLREVVARCHMRIRSRDVFIRWGGEEFLILVLDAGINEVARVAEQIRAIVSAEPLHSGILTSASFGVTSFHELDTPDTLIKRADQALYKAKSAGRDQVVIFEHGNDEHSRAG